MRDDNRGAFLHVIIILDSGEKEEVEIRKIRKCLLIAKVNCAVKYVDIRKIAAVIVNGEEHKK